MSPVPHIYYIELYLCWLCITYAFVEFSSYH